ncbi:uncharacterized protein LOC119596208 [Penaeus monodon]|uniref:uncharacterized protein LOC119596208 n=1 Tax=Penaeus monodon TaxID=6687 RepID=UPI0018A7C6DF|nr:uncharacterized protein LOC119596208 [Penaeus monodon]
MINDVRKYCGDESGDDGDDGDDDGDGCGGEDDSGKNGGVMRKLMVSTNLPISIPVNVTGIKEKGHCHLVEPKKSRKQKQHDLYVKTDAGRGAGFLIATKPGLVKPRPDFDKMKSPGSNFLNVNCQTYEKQIHYREYAG